jgi:hypothetical protein
VVAIAQRQQAGEQRSLAAGAGDRSGVASAQVAGSEAQLLLLAAAFDAQSAFGSLEDAYRRPLQGSEIQLPLPGNPQS